MTTCWTSFPTAELLSYDRLSWPAKKKKTFESLAIMRSLTTMFNELHFLFFRLIIFSYFQSRSTASVRSVGIRSTGQQQSGYAFMSFLCSCSQTNTNTVQFIGNETPKRGGKKYSMTSKSMRTCVLYIPIERGVAPCEQG